MKRSSSSPGLSLTVIAVLTTMFSVVLPWVSYQFGQQARADSPLKALAFPSLRDQTLNWANFDQAVVFQGEMFFVDRSRTSEIIRAVNLSTGRIRFVEAAPPQAMLLVHQDRVQVLPAPPILVYTVLDPWWPWQYVGPFVFRDRPTILKGPMTEARTAGFGCNYEILSYDGATWVSIGRVPLPQSFGDWQSKITEVLDDGQRLWIVAFSELRSRFYCRCGLVPSEDDEQHWARVVQQQFYPLWNEGAVIESFEEPVSALEPANVNEWPEEERWQPTSAANPENVEPPVGSDEWRERRRAEAAPDKQPASAIDPENAPDWAWWFEVFDTEHAGRGWFFPGDEPEGPRFIQQPAAELFHQEGLFNPHMYRTNWSARILANGYPTIVGFNMTNWHHGPNEETVRLPPDIAEHESFRRESREILNIQQRVIRSIARFGVGYSSMSKQTTAVRGSDGTLYLVTTRQDGYIEIRRLIKGRIEPVTSLSGPLPRRVLFELLLLFLWTIILPAFLFRAVGAFLSHGHQDTMGEKRMAPLWRRGLARWLDLVLIALPVGVTLLMHPDFVV